MPLILAYRNIQQPNWSYIKYVCIRIAIPTRMDSNVKADRWCCEIDEKVPETLLTSAISLYRKSKLCCCCCHCHRCWNDIETHLTPCNYFKLSASHSPAGRKGFECKLITNVFHPLLTPHSRPLVIPMAIHSIPIIQHFHQPWPGLGSGDWGWLTDT